MALFGFGKKRDKQQRAAPPSGEVTLSDGTRVSITKQVDCLGYSCPRPQLMTRKALDDVAPGDVIAVLVDNPSSMEAIPPMLGELAATHLETVKAERRWEIYIRKE